MTNDELNIVEQALGLLEEAYDELPPDDDLAVTIADSMSLLDSLFEGNNDEEI